MVQLERGQGGRKEHRRQRAQRDAHGDGEIRGAEEREYEQKGADAQKHQQPIVILELQVHLSQRLQSKSGAKRRSADFQSAVSRIFNLRGRKCSEAPGNSYTWPNAIRRYSRLKICATHCTICGIFWMTAVVNSTRERTIHGSSSSNTPTTANAFGTKASVCSWMVVTAWNKLMARPMIIATMRTGAAMESAWSIIVLRSSMAN